MRYLGCVRVSVLSATATDIHIQPYLMASAVTGDMLVNMSTEAEYNPIYKPVFPCNVVKGQEKR